MISCLKIDRNIVSIRYNVLNLPDTIQFKNGNQIINRYTANGIKQRADYYTALTQELLPIGGVCQWVNRPSDVVHTRTDYSGTIEYETDQSGVTTLSRVHNPEGYRGSDGMYYFYIKDYQGNICSVWRWDNTYVQTTQYYADGLPKNTSTNAAVQPYKYNGKEFITMHGLDTYDYGARGYYPALGRFTSVDPLAETTPSVSPYAYCMGNPINYIDPFGLETIPVDDLPENWDTFNPNEDDVALNEVTVTPTPDNSNDNSNTSQNVNYSLWRMLSDSNDNQRRSVPQGGEDASWLKTTSDIFSAAGIGRTAKTELIDFAVRGYTGLSKKSFNKLSNYSKTAIEVRVLGATGARYLRVSKGLGYLGAGVGVASAGYQLIQNPTVGNATRLAVQGVSISTAFIPVIGWGISPLLPHDCIVWQVIKRMVEDK